MLTATTATTDQTPPEEQTAANHLALDNRVYTRAELLRLCQRSNTAIWDAEQRLSPEEFPRGFLDRSGKRRAYVPKDAAKIMQHFWSDITVTIGPFR